MEEHQEANSQQTWKENNLEYAQADFAKARLMT